MPDHVSLAAPAKVTLFLHIVGQDDAGMHLLEGLAVFPDAADRVTVRPALDLTITVAGPFADSLPPDSEHAEGAPVDNLALQAARALRAAAGISAGAHIHLQKHLPIAAGLGGGSADAAATMHALTRLWKIPATAVDLAALGLELGADVPMCLAGGGNPRSSLFAGVGERLRPAPAYPECGMILVNPRQGLLTSEVFRARQGAFTPSDPFFPACDTVDDLTKALAARANDLTGAASALCPQIPEVLAALKALPGCRLARLCGSGATCFGLFDTVTTAAAAAPALRNPGWWVRAAALPACKNS